MNLPFKSGARPERRRERNHSSARDASEEVTELLKELERKGVVRRVPSAQAWVVSALGAVRKQSGKVRIIHDLRYLNTFLETRTFAMDTLVRRQQIFNKGGFIMCWDLSMAYYHLGIAPEDQKFLALRWEGEFYVWTVLPFGLSTAPYAFSKLMEFPMRFLRETLRAELLQYLDDLTAAWKDEEAARGEAHAPRVVLEAAGFIVEDEKSTPEPVQRAKVLGIVVDLARGVFELPVERKAKLIAQCEAIIEAGSSTGRDIARLAGGLIAAAIALPRVRLYTRSLFSLLGLDPADRGLLPKLAAAKVMLRRVPVGARARAELIRWRGALRTTDGVPFRREVLATRVIASDASARGWGGVLFGGSPSRGEQHQTAGGEFTPAERLASSTLREAWAVERTLRALRPKPGARIKFQIDNQAAVSVMRHGSAVSELHDVALRVAGLAERSGWELEFVWIPREENTTADNASRWADTCDVRTGAALRRKLAEAGVVLDLYATDLNRVCEGYVSLVAQPQSLAVDAEAVDWDDLPVGHAYAFPPAERAEIAWRSALSARRRVTLLMPHRPHAGWFIELRSATRRSGRVIEEVIVPGEEAIEGTWPVAWGVEHFLWLALDAK